MFYHSTIFVLTFLFFCTPVFAQVIFSDDFESGTTFKSQWTPRPGSNKGLVTIATSLGNTYIPCNGNYGAAMGLSGDLSGTTTFNYLDLSLNLAGKTKVMLSFSLKDADNGYTENGILFSDDGGDTFSESTFFQFKLDEYGDDVCGQFPPIDIAKVSGLQLTSTFVIRFRSRHFKDFNTAGGRDGLMIDDVVVRESPVQYATLPFADDFEEDTLKNNWRWVDPYRCGGTASDPGQIRPDGVVAPLSSFAGVSFPPYSGNQVLAMGQRQDPGSNSYYVVNALDLHLNLLNRPQAELRFNLQDWDASYNSNNPAEIGLFFSNNGGVSFKKVYDLPFNKWTDDVWGELMIDIDKLAAANGLYPFSDKFVIRFQERFNRDFNYIGGRQAVLIDNVRVTTPSIKYATVPFCDGFETGLPEYWYRADAFINGMTISDPSWIRPDALLDVLSSYAGINFPAHEGSKVLAMGMRQDPAANSYYAVNAADLRVNLQGVNGAKLNFWMKDYSDTNQDEDGVYFSNNGGETFKQVYTFNPAGTADDWTKYTLDLDALCVQYSLTKTSTFVIRFQQRGNRDFSSAGGSQGFIIDEVGVCIPPASITVTGANTTCGQSNGSASAPAGYASYLWSNGKTTREINGLSAGFTSTTYTVTVTTSDGCGCTASGSVTIGGSCTPPSITAVVTNSTSCISPNGKISLVTISLCSPVTYIWSNGSTTKDPLNLAAGTYTVTVTDNKGCTSTSSAVVASPTVASLSLSVTHTTCGLANGKITVVAQGGAGVSSWKWTGPNDYIATTPTINGLVPGNYTVTMTDVNGCTSVASSTVNGSLAAPSPGLVNDTTLQQGQSTIFLCAIDIPGASYKWSNGAMTRCDTVAAGTYTVTVTVPGGCTSTNVITVNIFSHCTFSVSNPMPCPGDTVTFTVINPMPGSTYKWDLDGLGGFNNGTGTPQTFIYPYSASATNFTVRLEKDGAACPGLQTVAVKAGQQPTIGVALGGAMTGNLISICNDAQPVILKVVNTSIGWSNFTGYSINWGDGSPIENYTNLNFNPNTLVSHNYFGLGYKTITLSATHTNGCALTKTYQIFKGNYPSIGIQSEGNTQGLCVPATLRFPLSFYADNTPGTLYAFKVNETVVATYSQDNVPAVFEHTFTESSCGQTPTVPGIQNAFDVSVVAENPCGKGTAGVYPITLSSKPVPDFLVQTPANNWPGETFIFTNTSANINEFNPQTSGCADSLAANWQISPGTLLVDWIVDSGGLLGYNLIKVMFLKPGTYTIEMTLMPEPNCGPAVISKTVTVVEKVVVNAGYAVPETVLETRPTVWPNPASSGGRIRVEAPRPVEFLALSSADGRLLRMAKPSNSGQFSEMLLPDVPSGLYHLWVQTGDGLWVVKIVIE